MQMKRGETEHLIWVVAQATITGIKHRFSYAQLKGNFLKREEGQKMPEMLEQRQSLRSRCLICLQQKLSTCTKQSTKSWSQKLVADVPVAKEQAWLSPDSGGGGGRFFALALRFGLLNLLQILSCVSIIDLQIYFRAMAQRMWSQAHGKWMCAVEHSKAASVTLWRHQAHKRDSYIFGRLKLVDKCSRPHRNCKLGRPKDSSLDTVQAYNTTFSINLLRLLGIGAEKLRCQ